VGGSLTRFPRVIFLLSILIFYIPESFLILVIILFLNGSREFIVKAYLVMDIGTSSTKVTLFGMEGRQLASLRSSYSVQMPEAGWAEQDPQVWWSVICQLCPKVLACVESCEVLAVVVSGQSPSCVALDYLGTPLQPALLWLDRRSTAQVEWLRQHFGEDRAQNISTNRLDSYFGGVKWLWFIQNRPKLFERTWKILQANSFIIYKLTGRAVVDPSQAGLCSPCFDSTIGDWSNEVIEVFGLSREKLPEIMASVEVVGGISAESASLTGLKSGTPVICGGGDFACACLGAGVYSTGSAAMMLGTAGNLLIPNSPRGDSRLLNTFHVTGQRLSLGGVMAGGAIHWYTHSILGLEGDEYFSDLETQATKIPPGSNGLIFLPYLMGERTPIWDSQARAAWIGLTNRHTQVHLYRAVMEGVAYAYRQMVDVLRETGNQLLYIVAMDGGSNSAVWRQIFADILQLPIHWRGASSGTGLGAAFLAATAIGAEKNFTAVDRWLEHVQIIQPNNENAKHYDALFLIYTSLYPSLAGDFHALGQIG
jgi:xylulokinase